MASMNYFDSDMYNSTNTVVYFDEKDGITFFVHYPVYFLHTFIYVYFQKYKDFYINNWTHMNSKYGSIFR
jgi:hypothetical protein